MTKKIFLHVAFMLATVTVLYAQSNVGIHSYYLKDYDKAEAYFKEHITENPTLYNFYLGEIAFSKGDDASAQSFYNEGLRLDAESVFNKIGLAKIRFKTNPKEAEAALNDIAKKERKNIDVLLAVGRAYMDNGVMEQATQQVEAAKKIDAENPDIYILEGDIIMAENTNARSGDAAGKYEMATYFSPNYTLGYIKTAQFYESVNPNMAIEKLKTAIEKQPNDWFVYGYLGKIYTQNGFYPEAIAAFKKYMASDVYTVEDIERYARAYYFTNHFQEAEKLVNEGLGKNPNHFVLNRYKMYIANKTNQAEQGRADAAKFFSLRDENGYIAQDYSVYAAILNRLDKTDEAYLQYEKAIRLEPQNMDLYAEAAALARENKDYAKAAFFQRKLMDKKTEISGGNQEDVIDMNVLGYDYYSAGISMPEDAPSAEKADYLHRADSVFSALIDRASESYTGYRYRALTRHAINAVIEDGLAKPDYDKVVEILTKDGRELSASDKKVLLEAYNYLGYYYYMKSDKANTILYWEKVLELDPENKNAKLVLDDVKK